LGDLRAQWLINPFSGLLPAEHLNGNAMPDVFCLRPIKPDYEGWAGSCVASEIDWVKVWAENRDAARYKVARATDLPHLAKKSVIEKYGKIEFWESPWECPDVTSCEPDDSEPRPGHGVLLSDGRRLPPK
jgi:hypothetical protein